MRDVIWSLEPHTEAKHNILKRYLQAWFPIISSGLSQNFVYLDGFAGPGVYKGGECGSPVIALEALINHSLFFRMKNKKFYFLFIEKDEERAKCLKEVLKERLPSIPNNIEYSVKGAEFQPTIESILDSLEETGDKLAPTFAFIDPFGFSGFSVESISRLLQYKKCEVLITFMSGFAKRFLDDLREPALNNLFACEEWKEAINFDGKRRERYLLKLFKRRLVDISGVRHLRTFNMGRSIEQIIYNLVFATNNLTGLKVMKEAMWRVDPRGDYTFCDTTARQVFLTDFELQIPEIANTIYHEFMGKTVPINDIENFVIADTEFIFKRGILKYLEEEGKIEVKGRIRRGFNYPESCEITFTKDGL